MNHLGLVASSERMPPNGGRIEGGSPLAGHLDLSSLLVREAVQNSWDARDDDRGDRPVRFEIAGWDVDTDQLDHLRSLLPVDDLGGFERRSDVDQIRGILHPAVVLRRDSVRLLVISDRSTVGLCGPTRSGRAWIPVRHGRELVRGQQRFANFVRNVGRATADIGEGDGGAYGVGKSALWMASECGTVLIHTRTTDRDGNPTERFIGSVHGEHFYSDDVEYTGRHFVGELGADGIVEPLDGARAASAAKGLPLPAYSEGGEPVDGTSIVIVAPRLSLDWPTEMKRLRDAVRWQVWPKRVPGVRHPSASPDMEISLSWNNHAVELPSPLEDPEIRPYAKALLDCARDRNSDEEDRDFVAECRRPQKVLGVTKFRVAGDQDQNVFHITLSSAELSDARKRTGLEESGDDEPAVDFSAPWGQIALIRREPLLLVRYEPIGGPESAETEVGVFLSADDLDVEEALTKAEPPAHDDWIHRIVPKDHPRDHRRTLAKRTLEEIRSARSQLLARYRKLDGGSRGSGEQDLSKRISHGLLGGLGGRPAPKPSEPTQGSRSSGPRAVLTHVNTYRAGTSTVHELAVSLSGLAQGWTGLRLTASGSARDSTGAMSVDDLVDFGWSRPDGTLSSGASLEVTGDEPVELVLVVRLADDLRFRPKVDVEVIDAA